MAFQTWLGSRHQTLGNTGVWVKTWWQCTQAFRSSHECSAWTQASCSEPAPAHSVSSPNSETSGRELRPRARLRTRGFRQAETIPLPAARGPGQPTRHRCAAQRRRGGPCELMREREILRVWWPQHPSVGTDHHSQRNPTWVGWANWNKSGKCVVQESLLSTNVWWCAAAIRVLLKRPQASKLRGDPLPFEARSGRARPCDPPAREVLSPKERGSRSSAAQPRAPPSPQRLPPGSPPHGCGFACDASPRADVRIVCRESFACVCVGVHLAPVPWGVRECHGAQDMWLLQLLRTSHWILACTSTFTDQTLRLFGAECMAEWQPRMIGPRSLRLFGAECMEEWQPRPWCACRQQIPGREENSSPQQDSAAASAGSMSPPRRMGGAPNLVMRIAENRRFSASPRSPTVLSRPQCPDREAPCHIRTRAVSLHAEASRIASRKSTRRKRSKRLLNSKEFGAKWNPRAENMMTSVECGCECSHPWFNSIVLSMPTMRAVQHDGCPCHCSL